MWKGKLISWQWLIGMALLRGFTKGVTFSNFTHPVVLVVLVIVESTSSLSYFRSVAISVLVIIQILFGERKLS